MTKETFDKIFDEEILPFIEEIKESNSRIQIKDLEKCKGEIYKEYEDLNSSFKKVIFSNEEENLLDRHKVAACICGAFLKVSVFNKQKLVEEIQKTQERIEAWFYYVNELVAFQAGCRFLSFFMVYESQDKEIENKAEHIIMHFPILPKVKQTPRGCYSSLLFYLSRIKDKNEIGLEHYDKYAYSMYFYMLEEYYDEVWNWKEDGGSE